MRPLWRRTVACCAGTAACAVLVFLCYLFYPAAVRAWKWSRLKALAATDLRSLDGERIAELLDELVPPESPGDDFEGWVRERWIPWALLPLKDDRGDEALVLAFVSPLVSIPGASAAAFVTYPRSGDAPSRTSFSTGWRADVLDVGQMEAPGGRAVIVIETGAGINGRGFLQYYAIAGGEIELVRLEDGGKLEANDYGYPNHTIGPHDSLRDAAEWKRRIAEGTWAERLSALVWLGGRHQIKRAGNVFQETEEEVKRFQRVAGDPEVQAAVTAMRSDSDPWIREAATATTKEHLDIPFPFDAIAETRQEEDTPEIVTFYGEQLEGDGVFYVIDRSASMGDRGELAIAKRELAKNIQEFSERVEFGIVMFDMGVATYPSNGMPAQANRDMKASAMSFVQAAQPGNGSCCQQGLATGLRMANMATARRKVMVYLGDGRGQCQGADEGVYLRQTLSAISSLNVQRIKINCIMVLDVTPIGEDFLKRLAALNNGTYSVKVR